MSRTVSLISTWTLPDDFLGTSGTAYFDEGAFEQFVDELAQVAGFARGVGATSATNVTPATGPVSLTTHQDAADVAIPAGALVRVQSAANAGKYMVGTVEAFAGTTLDLDVTLAAGAAASDWVIGYPVPGVIQTLAGNLDAAGNSISALLNLGVTGTATLASLIVSGAVSGGYGNLGDVTGAAAVAAVPYSRAKLTGDTTFTIADPPANSVTPGKGLEIEQGDDGGWVPTFAGYTAVGALVALDWSAQPAGTRTVLTHFATPTGLKFIGLFAVVEAP